MKKRFSIALLSLLLGPGLGFSDETPPSMASTAVAAGDMSGRSFGDGTHLDQLGVAYGFAQGLLAHYSREWLLGRTARSVRSAGLTLGAYRSLRSPIDIETPAGDVRGKMDL